ncbi:MAG: cytochrome P450, partial [Verrucomicrobia bacterium]|nr:cytochrome P450 [Verrucomicrobiota bacterium]
KAAIQAREKLNQMLAEMINDRRNSAVQGEDLFSLLFSAQDNESGARMSDQQLRDEAMTLFLAGHETTANGLCWTLFLLAKHPEIQTRLHVELETVLEGQRPTVTQLGRLVYLEKVIRESLRLYPPAYIMGRRTVQDYSLAGVKIPAGSILFFSQWTTQRSSRLYSDPDIFDPERWTPQFLAALPRFGYFPFGGGPRQCIGEGFAWMEMSLVLAFLIQKWRFELIPGQSIKPKPAMTLRSSQPIYMRLSSSAQRSTEES